MTSSDGPAVTAPADARPHPSELDASAVAEGLGTDPDTGLTDEEAALRLQAYGPNAVRSAPPVPLWKRILDQFRDPLVSLLLVAIAIALVAWGFEGYVGVPVDAVVIAVIVVLNATIGLVQESKAADAVAALSTMTAAASTVLRDGRRLLVPSADLVPGDVLLLAEGDSVGADGRVIEAHDLSIQESSLTGESDAVAKDPGTLPVGAPIGDRTDMAHAGTAVSRGTGTVLVTATGMDTEMGAIAQLLDETEQEDTPLERELATVSRNLGVIVIVMAVVVMAALFATSDVTALSDAVTILLLGVSMAVAAVPEGLPAILSIVLALGVRALAERNAVVKNLHSAETLGSASVIASDKTGTLTRNEMTVEQCTTAGGTATFTGGGYDPDGTVDLGSQDYAVPPGVLHEVRRLLLAGALANDGSLERVGGQWTITGDPTDAALAVAARKRLPDGTVVDTGGWRRLDEVPFSSERKMMSVVCAADGRVMVFAKGAPDVLIGHCTRVADGDGERLLDETTRQRVLASVDGLSAKAYRTLGVADRRLDGDTVAALAAEGLERDLTFIGVVAIMDPPREEARAAIAAAHRAGIRTVMITGDHPTTAAAIAAKLGLDADTTDGLPPRVITGADIDRMSPEEFDRSVEHANVYARVAPGHKLRLVDALQHDGHVVAMTGDGVNDAPALKSADIGVAMGITGTEVTKEAATMVLADDNYATIIEAVRRGRNIYDNITKFLRYLLSSNVGEVITIFFGVILAGALGLAGASDEAVIVPLLATQVLWINLVTDTAPALAMGVDPDVDDTMSRRPRDVSRPILDGRAWADIVLTGLVMGTVTLLSMDLCLPGGLVGEVILAGDVFGSDDLTTARTVALTTLVFCQLFNAFNARSYTASAFRSMFTNAWLWGAIAFGIVAQIALVYLPFLQTAFSTAPIDGAHWLLAIGLASVTLWFQELVKVIRRAAARA